jgi:hypothetical protein
MDLRWEMLILFYCEGKLTSGLGMTFRAPWSRFAYVTTVSAPRHVHLRKCYQRAFNHVLTVEQNFEKRVRLLKHYYDLAKSALLSQPHRFNVCNNGKLHYICLHKSPWQLREHWLSLRAEISLDSAIFGVMAADWGNKSWAVRLLVAAGCQYTAQRLVILPSSFCCKGIG